MSVYRKAILLKESKDGKKRVYIDLINHVEIFEFLRNNSQLLEKFYYIIELILEHHQCPSRLYGPEHFERGTENMKAMKLARGITNPRIYCQQYKEEKMQKTIIVVGELLTKKKSQGLSSKEKSIIKRVASYNYKLLNNENDY